MHFFWTSNFDGQVGKSYIPQEKKSPINLCLKLEEYPEEPDEL